MGKDTTIGVIGFGNFGKLAVSVLSKHFKVLVYDTSKRKDLDGIIRKCGGVRTGLRETAKCDAVILCTPISKTEEVIRKVVPMMKEKALLLDTCSVKELPCKWLKENATDTIEVIGTHPMFGPTTSKFNLEKQTWELKGLQIVLCPIKISKERLGGIKRFLKILELETIETTPEDHDRQNAKTLSFVHYIGRCLNASGVGHQNIYTPGYRDLLSILPHTTSDNWTLFYDMNNYNPYASPLRARFIDACLSMEEKIIADRESGEMEKQRANINAIDSHIIKLLERRMRSVERIREIKNKMNIPVKDKKREEELINRLKKETHLSGPFIKAIYTEIFKEAYKNQK